MGVGRGMLGLRVDEERGRNPSSPLEGLRGGGSGGLCGFGGV